eukprot:scaffold105433_cov31-Tisochrysis_lutea.AAC.9
MSDAPSGGKYSSGSVRSSSGTLRDIDCSCRSSGTTDIQISPANCHTGHAASAESSAQPLPLWSEQSPTCDGDRSSPSPCALLAANREPTRDSDPPRGSKLWRRVVVTRPMSSLAVSSTRDEMLPISDSSEDRSRERRFRMRAGLCNSPETGTSWQSDPPKEEHAIRSTLMSCMDSWTDASSTA